MNFNIKIKFSLNLERD